MSTSNPKSVLASVLCVALASASGLHAAPISFFQFVGDPDFRVRHPEFSYAPVAGLTEAPGAIGNGSFFAPGLIGVITGGMNGIALSPPGLGSGPTYHVLSDLTLDLTGFTANGPASVGPLVTSQGLNQGSFVLKYTPKNAFGQVIGPDVTLLSGSTSSATLIEANIGRVAAVLSGVVTYDGGLLYSQLASAGLSNKGSFAFAMTGLRSPYSIDVVTQQLGPFLADGVGTFDANPVPAPAAVSAGAGLLGLLGFARRRRAQFPIA